MKLLLLVVIAIALVGGQKGKGDQGPPVLEDSDDSDIKIAYEDDFDEDIMEMTPANTQSEAEEGSLERINEQDVDDEIASAERQESYPVWKILLIVAGCAVALALLVGAVILVIKSRSNNNEGKSSSKEEPNDDEGQASNQTSPVYMWRGKYIGSDIKPLN